MMRQPVATISTRTILAISKFRQPVARFKVPVRCSSDKQKEMEEMNLSYQPDKLEKWMLYKFANKGKYSSTSDVPKSVTRSEMESAKSKFRIAVNLVAMFALVVTAVYLLRNAKVEKTERMMIEVEKQKKN